MVKLNLAKWLLAGAFLAACGESLDTEDLCSQLPQGQVELPRDDGTHDQLFEWWYWTGHLKTEQNRWFGFELVFFQIQQETSIRMAQHAITDIQDQSFHHVADQMATEPVTFENRIDISQGALWARGQNGIDNLYGEVDGYQLDIVVESRKAPVLQHEVGFIEYDFGGNSYYYSRERMDAQGTLSIDGYTLTVDGSAWFDHQWGVMVEITGTSRNWFAIQLDDDREIMAFELRFQGVEYHRGGSYTTADCQTTELSPEDLVITPLDEWASPHTNCTYPVNWTIDTGELSLTLTAVLPDQEVYTSIPIYWEGAATVSGDATGRAFIELANYCQ
jgi:predicted secreted hydrolase